MIRVFLDANILFSAAYRQSNGILRLWKMKAGRLVTSPYAFAEAARNIAIKRPDAASRLAAHAASVEVSQRSQALRRAHVLPEKDRPILEAALGSGCTALLTGDIAHFGHLFGKTVEGVEIMTVSMFMKERDGNK